MNTRTPPFVIRYQEEHDQTRFWEVIQNLTYRMLMEGEEDYRGVVE